MEARFDGRDYHLTIDQKELDRFRMPGLTDEKLSAPILPWNRNVRLPRNDLVARLSLALTVDNEPDSISLLYKPPGDIVVAIGRGAYLELCATGDIVASYDGENKVRLQLDGRVSER